MSVPVVLCMSLFGIGLYGLLSRRDVIAVLASVEIMLVSANVLLIALARTGSGASVADLGRVEAVGVTIVVIAAAEAAVGMALLIAAVRRSGRQTVDEFRQVRG